MSYSLWLKPSRRQAHRLQQAMNSLASRYGAIKFSPHLTVCCGIPELPSRQSVRDLAARHRAPTLDALHVEHSGQLYQCLSLELRRHSALTALRADALEHIGGLDGCSPYRPHISMLYATISAAERAAIAKSLPAALLQRSKGDTLELMHTAGAARHWRVLEQFPLGD